MRIVAGRWRSRPLETPVGATTRPTADRARETLFSMLTSRLGGFEGLLVLDLFAGSGALALEALSRGAARGFLVERDPAARRAIESNIAKLGAEARLIGHDACSLPPAPAPADLIFLDPPYGEGLTTKALQSALTMGWVAPHTWISVETARGEELDTPGFEPESTRGVGKAELHLLRPKA
ncbi:16S rRNA (guanine(966)-N(2))-methyltransferase RsmD [Sandaracinobacter sp. RS1-74]|uniref:16S rRNA (guanine(966)-N(2))-methyltransferase RsmD n=1 Tax=Sandaracinobacteroides sayramensis TaxID=2913411 RepID=UPI001EDBF55C|nr:16S rRNA (guanine(966)-N(2))-methyltransferase RsmD [Sandaracinobacteroides sayramensis]MCG2841543.1 16S rRNA (guanine(966)-N(2))-methyltransferase RsmD [Sandaracinobacteroides sayramensis]